MISPTLKFIFAFIKIIHKYKRLKWVTFVIFQEKLSLIQKLKMRVKACCNKTLSILIDFKVEAISEIMAIKKLNLYLHTLVILLVSFSKQFSSRLHLHKVKQTNKHVFCFLLVVCHQHTFLHTYSRNHWPCHCLNILSMIQHLWFFCFFFSVPENFFLFLFPA